MNEPGLVAFEAFYAAYSRSKHLTQRTAVSSKNFRSSLPDIHGSPCERVNWLLVKSKAWAGITVVSTDHPSKDVSFLLLATIVGSVAYVSMLVARFIAVIYATNSPPPQPLS